MDFDAERLERFRLAYKKAEHNEFMFEGREFVKGYAKYLLQYLDYKFKGEDDAVDYERK